MNEEIIRNAFVKFKCDKQYSHGYERYYSLCLDDNIESILEVGIKRGNSLAAWRYLYPKAEICGVDITEKWFVPELIKFSNSKIIIQDSTKISLEKKYDLIIDDGSHFYKDIIRTFFNLKNNFNKYYIIEDAMYKQDFIVRVIKKLGFNNIKVYDSNKKNIPLYKDYVTKNIKDNKKKILVDLKLIIVSK